MKWKGYAKYKGKLCSADNKAGVPSTKPPLTHCEVSEKRNWVLYFIRETQSRPKVNQLKKKRMTEFRDLHERVTKGSIPIPGITLNGRAGTVSNNTFVNMIDESIHVPTLILIAFTIKL